MGKILKSLIILFFILINCFTSTFANRDRYFERDRFDYFTTFNYTFSKNIQVDFKPSITGIFGITPRNDFLKNTFNSGRITAWEKNNNFSDNMKTFVAPNLNLSDYSGFDIKTGGLWEQYSSISSLYEPQDFSNIGIDNQNRLTSFDMVSARKDCNVLQKATAEYDQGNKLNKFTMQTRDLAGNSYTQNLYDLKFEKNPDALGYSKLVETWERNCEIGGKFGYISNLKAIKSGIDSPQQVATAFKIDAIDTRGNLTQFAFDCVVWKMQRVESFKATVNEAKGIQTDWEVESVTKDNWNIERQSDGITETYTTSEISLEALITQLGRGNNPLAILGSERLQIGDSKVVLLDVVYDEDGLLEGGKANQFLNDYATLDEQQEKKTSNNIIDKISYWLDERKDKGLVTELKQDIKNYFNIDVYDGTEKWTATELKLVSDILLSLPKDFCNPAVNTIMRMKEGSGAKAKRTRGSYENNGVIKMTNISLLSSQFKNSPAPIMYQFAGTFVHELTHAQQFYNPINNSIFDNPYENPLVIKYAEITGWIINARNRSSYNISEKLYPSEYSKKNVLEDMSEASKFYYCNGNYLKENFPERYEFLKEHLFNGRQYR